MTLPGDFGEGEQGPNVQRMVVTAWALTYSFVGLGGKWPSLVLKWLIPSLVLSQLSSLRRRHLSAVVFWYNARLYRLILDASALVLGPSNVRRSACMAVGSDYRVSFDIWFEWQMVRFCEWIDWRVY